jgi:POT family proton-dependent oligopeptide transporter
MVTKLAPSVLVSTVMGAWFLATAFSQFLAAIIAQFTNVTEGMEGEIPVPIDTVEIYGDVFRGVGLTAVASGVICLLLVPLLKAWMHPEVTNETDPS